LPLCGNREDRATKNIRHEKPMIIQAPVWRIFSLLRNKNKIFMPSSLAAVRQPGGQGDKKYPP
jgi:hypothetical protein